MTRRDHPSARVHARVPVVMPMVAVTIGTDGHASVTLDGEAYNVEGHLTRAEVTGALNQIAAELGSAIRAEICEADGTRFADFITPESHVPDRNPETEEVTERVSSPVVARPVLASPFGISGSGFTAGEEVAVCLVVSTHVADAEGNAHLRLPPALLARHPHVVLVGRESGAVALSASNCATTHRGR